MGLFAAQMKKFLADNAGNAFVENRNTRFGVSNDGSGKRRKHETLNAFKRRIRRDRMKTMK